LHFSTTGERLPGSKNRRTIEVVFK
jgi:hypothetical protein